MPRQPEIGSPCPGVRRVRQGSGGRYALARKTPLQDRRPGDRSVRLPSNKLPEQTWRGRARERPKRQESNVLQPRHRLNGKAEACQWPGQRAPDGAKARACFECQTRHAKVHASSHVLIGERGRTRANTHTGTSCSDVVSQNGLKPWPERALHRSDHWS